MVSFIPLIFNFLRDIIFRIHSDTGYTITCIVDGEFDQEKMTYKISPDGPQTDECALGSIHCITATNGKCKYSMQLPISEIFNEKNFF